MERALVQLNRFAGFVHPIQPGAIVTRRRIGGKFKCHVAVGRDGLHGHNRAGRIKQVHLQRVNRNARRE